MSLIRARKWAASKFSDTKAGRATVQKTIGEDGDAIITALHDAAKHLYGEKVAKNLKKTAIRLMLKVAINYTDNAFDENDVSYCVEPLLTLGRMVIDFCTKGPDSISQLPMLLAGLKATYEMIMPLLTPVMKKENSGMLTTLYEKFGSEKFLTAFLNEMAMAGYRTTIGTSMNNILKAHTDSLSATQRCSVPGCLLPRCDIKGTQYCTGHHAVKYSVPPTLDEFLHNTEHTRLLQEYVFANGHKDLLDFVIKTEGFKSITTRSIRKARAQFMFKSFILRSSPTAMKLSDEVVAKIEEELEYGRSSLFNAAREEVMDQLDEVFCGPFRASPQYAEFARLNLGIKVPPMLGIARVHAASSGGANLNALWTDAAESGTNTGSVAYVQAKFVNGASDMGIARAKEMTEEAAATKRSDEAAASAAAASGAGSPGVGAGAGVGVGAGSA